MADLKTSTITIDFGPWGTQQSFATIDELRQWVQAEENSWSELMGSIRKGDTWKFASQACDVMGEKFSDMRTAVSPQPRGNPPTPPELDVAGAGVQNALRRSSDYYVPWASPAGQLIRELCASDRMRGAAALLNLLRIDFRRRGNTNPYQDPWSPSFFPGMLDAGLFEAGIGQKSIDAQQAAMRALELEWREKLDKIGREYQDQIQNNRVDLDLRIRAEASHDAMFTEQLNIQQNAFSTAIRLARKEFTDLQEVFKKHLALESPVRYWSDRGRNGHIAGGIVIGAAICGGVSLAWYFQSLVSNLISGVTHDPLSGNPVPQLDWPHYSIAGGTLLLGAWGIRILLRLGFGLWDSATDAGERATIIKTYLALMKDPGSMPGEAITVLLQAIVRPSGSRGENPGLIDAEALKQAAELVKR